MIFTASATHHVGALEKTQKANQILRRQHFQARWRRNMNFFPAIYQANVVESHSKQLAGLAKTIFDILGAIIFAFWTSN